MARILSYLGYGENSGDSMHVDVHLPTLCHYQIFF